MKIGDWVLSPGLVQALMLALGVAVVVLLVRGAQALVRRRVADSDARYRANKAAVIAGYVVVLMLLVGALAGELSGLSIALGAASAGIAFALQEVIASFAGWLALTFSNFYKIGDRVQLGGIRGDVIDIGFLRTTIMECGAWVQGDLYNGRIVRVANSYVFKEPVYNYSGDFPFLWDELVLPVRYGSDYAAARGMMLEAAQAVTGEYTEGARSRWRDLVLAYRIEDARLDPVVTIVPGDNWVTFTLRYVVDHRLRRSTQDALFTRILSDVESSGGAVQLASATFELVAAPPLQVAVSPAAPGGRGPGGA